MKSFLRFFVASVLITLAAPALAQEFRATVTGRVTDTTGGAMPGVTMTVTNTVTNEVATTTTNAEGLYSLPFLRPGVYKITAQLSGFRRHEQTLQLEVGQSQTVNIALQIGNMTETVTVTAEAIEATKADRGMVIDKERITELPLNARNPFMLSTLSAGITYNGPAIYQRPFDNGAIADWSINGGQNRNNEFLLDGAPNNSIQGGNNIAYVPSVDAVQEFKIITNSYDAQYGRTAGGVINVSLKSGTNRLHGTGFEFARRRSFDALDYFNKINKVAKPDHSLDQYGFQIDGPVLRNRTFFMFTFEGYQELTPNQATYTVPDDAQLRGDFSNLRNAQGQLITIYDPNTGTLNANGQWVREPFFNNIIPDNRINPIARNLAKYFLRPNQVPVSGDPWRQNFLAAPNLADDTYYNVATKVDQNFSDRTRMFFRYGYNTRAETRWTNGVYTGPAQDGQLPLERVNHTGVVDWVRTVSSSLVVNIRSGLNQYLELARSDPGLNFNPTELGFPASMVDQLPNKVFPRINVTDYQAIGRNSRASETTTVFSLQPNMSWLRGRHSVRSGLDMRMTWYTREINNNLFVLSFDRRFTQQNFNSGNALSGNSIASFLLGAASGGTVDNNFYPTFRWNYYAPWIQDDWKITNRLTLNLGLRYDANSPVFEKQNRINYGFDTTAVNPISSALSKPVYGGIGFVAVGGNPKSPYKRDQNNFQPRAGFAYMLNDRTIVRGGYGRYFLNLTTIGQTSGFSQATNVITSLDGDRTSTYPLSNPFPQGMTQPAGSSLGMRTFLGRGLTFSNPDFVNPYVHQFSLGIQRLLPWRTSVDISYVGSRTVKEQSSWGGFNEPPVALRDQCDPTKGGSPAFCTALLPNPFFQVPGFEGTTRFTNATLSRYELSRPFPQFGGITMSERNDGRIWYDSAQIVVNKRSSAGVTLNGTYTWAKMWEETGTLNDVDQIVMKAPYTTDRRHRVTLSGVLHVPVGRDRRFLRQASPLVDAILGGWEMAGTWLFNSGRPWDLPGNVYYVKDATITKIDFGAERIIRGVQNCVAQMSDLGVVTMQSFSVAAGCTEPNFIIKPNFTPRSTTFRDDKIRRPPFYQFDMNFAKTFQIRASLRVQFRAELFNVLNQPMYDERTYNNNPTDSQFGVLDRSGTRQSNFPRYGQLGVKLIF
jgi:hypothetical protein